MVIFPWGNTVHPHIQSLARIYAAVLLEPKTFNLVVAKAVAPTTAAATGITGTFLHHPQTLLVFGVVD